MMKIVSSLLLTQLTCLVRGDVGWSEFGRQDRANANAPRRNRVTGLEAPVKSKPQDMIRREKSTSWSAEDSLEEIFDVSRSTLELSMDMSFSMSMSMATSVPITIPTSSPVTSVPNPIPTPAPAPTLGPPGPPGPPTTTPPNQTRPSLPPFSNFTRGPTGEPGTPSSTQPAFPPLPPAVLVAPSSETQTPPTGFPSIEPTSEPSISNPPTGEFLPNSDCLSTSKIRLGDELDNSTTAVPLEIGYIVESYSSSVEAFTTELEEELIATAVFAIFGCNPDTSGINPETLEVLDVDDKSLFIETCENTINNGTDCYVMETNFIIWVEGPVESEIATYKAYIAIQDAMPDDEVSPYVETVPDLVNVKYLSPSPLLEPPGFTDDESTSPGNAGPSKLTRDASASRWTIGASVASLMGGIVSIMVFVRSRRSRQRRHLLAEETTPWVSPGNDNAVM